ncbi:NAD(+) diphosphatase [Leeia sp. TBRC 13508]|uniref:NAD(+) diphosphatase n=1 Tax=Leeia speluncae TaxID=2884804 RepID=A0ABS8D5N5_9NEIS|nr:NAD(+) diphosphatase [Leeia speluncae]MCB6183313.1 NAD(+) diphosphatase [Leeia speluncae]
MLPFAFEPTLTPSAPSTEAPLLFGFYENELCYVDAHMLSLPNNQSYFDLVHHYIGDLAGQHCYAVDLTEKQETAGRWLGLRAAFAEIEEHFVWIAARALQILEWDRSNRFCGRCGTSTTIKLGERARVCPSCGQLAYPRISPAMMVLIKKDKQLLLARGPHFPPGVYSALAGFVEPGESIEQTIHREAMEEVGIKIKNLRYFNSQCWPFPHSLMLAFVADYDSGEITPDDNEIEDARWFSLDELPTQPFKYSIANKLINGLVDELTREG